MAQGEFTKEEAVETVKSVEEMFEAISRAKRSSFLGHLNDVLMFIAAAERKAPAEKASEPASPT